MSPNRRLWCLTTLVCWGPCWLRRWACRRIRAWLGPHGVYRDDIASLLATIDDFDHG